MNRFLVLFATSLMFFSGTAFAEESAWKEIWSSRLITASREHFSNFQTNLNKLAKISPGKLKECANNEALDCYAPYNEALAASYYDLGNSFYRLAEMTGDLSWKVRAAKATIFYRDSYINLNEGGIPGYWIFTEGLYRHYLESKDPKSKEALELITKNAAYARDTTDPQETVDPEFSRETAYVILAYLRAEKLGAPRRPRLDLLVQHALGHLEKWARAQTSYMRPFMVALTCRALAEFYDQLEDSEATAQIKKKIKISMILALDRVWESCWSAQDQAFRYTNKVVESPEDVAPAPDLGFLIAPAYKWLGKSSKIERFLSRAEEIYRGGASTGFLGNPKQFNQNLFW